MHMTLCKQGLMLVFNVTCGTNDEMQVPILHVKHM